MKRRFIGGILLNSENQVLLLGRSVNDEDMGGMWSLPAGEVEEGEDNVEALKREFKEETGIDITVGDKIKTISREKWQVSMYEVNQVGGKLTLGLEDDVDDLKYFDFENLPEKIVLEAHIGLLTFLQKEGKETTIFADRVEAVFSSIYYSYLDSAFQEYSEWENLEMFSFIVRNTPYRKYKSCIPYLLSGCNPNLKFDVLVPEIQFAVWTLLDNLCDKRFYKYDKPTSLKTLGYEKSVINLYTIISTLEAFFIRRDKKDLGEKTKQGLLTCGKGQQERFETKSYTDLENYLSYSYKRSRFLEISWCTILENHGYFKESELISKIYPISSKTGQLLNDYYDLRENINDYEDFEEGIVSSYLILLENTLSTKEDKEELKNILESEDRKSNKRRFKELVKNNQIREKLKDLIKDNVSLMLKEIEESQIENEKKKLLKFWIDIQFLKFIDSDIDYFGKLDEFIQTIDNLCQNIK